MKHRKLLIIAGIVVGACVVATIPGYFVAKRVFEGYFGGWGEKLVGLEKRGLLSTEFGAAWQDILTDEAMEQQAASIAAPDTTEEQTGPKVVDGVRLSDYPSLSLVARLNEVNRYSNTIDIVDRRERQIATIRTDHTRGNYDEFPKALISCLVAAEDENFFTNDLGFEFRSYVRAVVDALKRSLFSLRLRTPRGTSTITQQTAKLFISHLDEEGQRHVSRSVDRKLREMRIAAALRKLYTPEEILEVYLNHCVTSDYGLIGYKDIARNLFDKELSELTDAECAYLARMVKWGRNLKDKIVRQCRIDMPRMAAANNWDKAYQDSIFAELDSLTFTRPKRIVTEHGILVDWANEYWLRVLQRNGHSPADVARMDIIDPNSLIRKKGNLRLQLTADLPLQTVVEALVAKRGFGPDTTIITEARIGSFGEDLTRNTPPDDTLRRIEVLTEPREFSEPNEEFVTSLESGDTLITNVRYRKIGARNYRRSVFYYNRRLTKVDGQYYAYALMDSRTGKLLAYCSRDRIGSRLAGLNDYRTPNGSSTAKPIFNALNFDLGIFEPYSMWNDSVAVTDDVAWKRTLEKRRGKPIGVIFAKSAVRGKGYHVHNHGYVFEGCQYIFDALATSNNIFGVESCYRLDRLLYDRKGEELSGSYPFLQFFYRMGALPTVSSRFRGRPVTGVRFYKELVRVLGVDVDSSTVNGRRRPISDSLYSVALGTMELTLLEQLHLYNVLYDNNLIGTPAAHPSLFVESIMLNARPVAARDTIKRYHPFADVNNLRPTYLGMHKRLTSNKWDRLGAYDIAYPAQTIYSLDTTYDEFLFPVDTPLANYAKSGTTDDVIRPFHASSDSKERTNFGLWNAVIRIDLSKLSGDTVPDVRDVTVACVGECNKAYTGERDGKTLHKFVTAGLLRKAGLKSPNGFFTRYEQYIRAATPDSVRDCGRYTPPAVEPVPDVDRDNSHAEAVADSPTAQ